MVTNETARAQKPCFGRLAGDTHLIAWPDISLLGENLRLKDTEYSEVETSRKWNPGWFENV